MTFWLQLAQLPFSLEFPFVDGVRTRVLRAGTGEPVVFLHGTSGHLEAWIPNVTAFAPHLELHIIDMLGNGFTDAPGGDIRISDYVRHVLGYLDAAGLPRVHLVAESLGGWVAARLAADHPERVAKLVLVAPGGGEADPVRMARIISTTHAAVDSADRSLTESRVRMLFHDQTHVTQELIDMRYAVYHRPEFVEGLDGLLCLQVMENRLEDLLTTEQLGRIQAQTLIIWGVENPFGEVSQGEMLLGAIADSRLEVLSDCGHWPQLEQASAFNRLVLDFLAPEQPTTGGVPCA
jgi:2-hydroxy-6-oxonona-2,4-dienedioate hydrolase